MPQVSKIKLDQDLESALREQFWYSLGFANNSIKARDFFSDLLSSTEQMMLAKRLAAAVLVTRGKSSTYIHNSIHLSYSTISSVSSWVKNSKTSTNRLLKQIANEKRWEEILDKIEEIIDKIHPMPGTDWKQKYENKFNRVKQRSARADLR